MTKKNMSRYWPLLALILTLLSPLPVTAVEPELFTKALPVTLQRELITGASLPIRPTPDWPRLRRVYQQYGQHLLWHDPSGQISGAGAALQGFVRTVGKLGLQPHLYQAGNLNDPQLSPPDRIVRDDLLLTDGFLRLARHLAQGQLNPVKVDPLWKIPVEQADVLALLDRAVEWQDPISVLEALNPQSPEYRRLLQALSHYRRWADRGGWSSLPDAPLIHPGDDHDLIPLLRLRLIESDDNTPAITDHPRRYDLPLQQAVKAFQRAHGLRQDAIIGPETRTALNVTVEQRITQIISNLERWRWLPQQLGDRYILVNIGGYLVQLVKQGEVQLEKRAIIGQPKRSTPSISTQVTHLVLNPTWTVPRRIAVEDLLPVLRRDAEYLPRKNILIQRHEGNQWVEQDPAMIDWTRYNKDNFPFQLRQMPGDGNSLGRIKFAMPNPYAIYLHDTPTQSLFEQPVRDFSSGCVRVEGIRDFTDQLLAIDNPDAPDSLGNLLESRESSYHKLRKPINIYLVYFTAWVDQTGKTQFRPDIYNLDQPLILALQQLYHPHAQTLAHSEQTRRAIPE